VKKILNNEADICERIAFNSFYSIQQAEYYLQARYTKDDKL